jgi:hypothetical protein
MRENPRLCCNFCATPPILFPLQPHFARIEKVKQTAVELITTIHSAGGGAVAAAARAKLNDRLRHRVAAQPDGVDSARQSSFKATANSLISGNTTANTTPNRLIFIGAI